MDNATLPAGLIPAAGRDMSDVRSGAGLSGGDDAISGPVLTAGTGHFMRQLGMAAPAATPDLLAASGVATKGGKTTSSGSRTDAASRSVSVTSTTGRGLSGLVRGLLGRHSPRKDEGSAQGQGQGQEKGQGKVDMPWAAGGPLEIGGVVPGSFKHVGHLGVDASSGAIEADVARMQLSDEWRSKLSAVAAGQAGGPGHGVARAGVPSTTGKAVAGIPGASAAGDLPPPVPRKTSTSLGARRLGSVLAGVVGGGVGGGVGGPGTGDRSGIAVQTDGVAAVTPTFAPAPMIAGIADPRVRAVSSPAHPSTTTHQQHHQPGRVAASSTPPVAAMEGGTGHGGGAPPLPPRKRLAPKTPLPAVAGNGLDSAASVAPSGSRTDADACAGMATIPENRQGSAPPSTPPALFRASVPGHASVGVQLPAPSPASAIASPYDHSVPTDTRATDVPRPATTEAAAPRGGILAGIRGFDRSRLSSSASIPATGLSDDAAAAGGGVGDKGGATGRSARSGTGPAGRGGEEGQGSGPGDMMSRLRQQVAARRGVMSGKKTPTKGALGSGSRGDDTDSEDEGGWSD